jgi:tRNA(Ile)-lysidine synthase TilS/MesJ
MKTRIEERLKSLVKEANVRWNFFQKDERVLVGVSGSKESLALLQLLSKFELQIIAIFVNPTVKRNCLLENWCRNYGDYVEVDFQISEGNPKSQNFKNICRRKERRLILEYAQKNGILTIVCSQYREKIVESLLKSMFFDYKFSSYSPVEELFGGKYRIVRPFYLVPQELIESFVLKDDFEPLECVCDRDSNVQLIEMRELIKALQNKHNDIDFNDNLLTCLL